MVKIAIQYILFILVNQHKVMETKALLVFNSRMNYSVQRPYLNSDSITYYWEVYILFFQNLVITYAVFLTKNKGFG